MQQLINICKGLDVRLKGEAPLDMLSFSTMHYALVPDDFRWITPKLCVKEGDTVKVGTPVFYAKENEKIVFVSPVSGMVAAIVRGEKRKIEYIQFLSDGKFDSVPVEIPTAFNPNVIRETLQKYGLWNLLRERPFNRIAQTEATPKAIFISGFDTAPLAPDYAFLVDGRQAELQKGIDVVVQLTSGKCYFSLYKDRNNAIFEQLANVEFRYFAGKHPAGNIGTQIHKIAPVNKGEIVWHINPQALVMIGKLFLYRKLDFSKRVVLCGSGIKRAGYFDLVQGAAVETALQDSLMCEMPRIVSGNVLTGKKIDISGFTGWYDNQLTVIPEGGERKLFGWMAPGFRQWSFSHSYLSWFFPKKKYNFDTALHGGVRTLMLHTEYEKVFPFDILPAELLKACIVEDIDLMEALGIYEVTEEDFALCEVICPSKIEWQELIFKGLTLLYDSTR
ncbi:MAG: Na(+)-translocating NADH-quinone reductase subunit A [Bacteroidales bacterium]|nr:Na(+)-translocating NADH-quinone reductase subunit A [Bacteroidales bacterium]